MADDSGTAALASAPKRLPTDIAKVAATVTPYDLFIIEGFLSQSLSRSKIETMNSTHFIETSL